MELDGVLQRNVQTHQRTHYTEPRQHIVHWPVLFLSRLQHRPHEILCSTGVEHKERLT